MSANKKKMNNEIVVPAPAWTLITNWSGVDIDQDLTVPSTTLDRYVDLAVLLEDHQPTALTLTEGAALAGMVQGREVAQAVLGLLGGAAVHDVHKAWIELRSQLATVIGAVEGMRRSRVPSVAQRAGVVAAGVFDARIDLATVTPVKLRSEVERIRALLAADEAKRAALREFVPDDLLEALATAHDQLRIELQRKAAVDRLPVKPRLVRDLLRRRVARYVRCVAATADEADLVSVQRMLKALAPLAELRAANARRRGAGAEVADPEVEEADDDVEPDPPPAIGGDTQ